MGYTHSTYRPPSLDPECFRRFAADVRTLVAAVAPGVSVRGGEGAGEPVVTDEMVLFNGDRSRGEHCEPFLITRDLRPELGQRVRRETIFSACKTEHLPYDALVVAASFALMYHCRGVEFHSDGRLDQFREGYDLFIRACKPDLGGKDLLAEVRSADTRR